MPPVQGDVTCNVKNTFMMSALAFLKNSSIAGRVLWDISSACVGTKPRGIKITLVVVTGDNPCKFIL